MTRPAAWALAAGGAALGAGLGWVAERRWLAPQRRGPIRPVRVPAPDRELVVTAEDGTRLHVEVHGESGPAGGSSGGSSDGPSDGPSEASHGAAPTIVFAHGWMMQTAFWRAQIADLAGRWRLVTYDHRGHGRSEIPVTGDWSTRALGGDLRAVIDAAVPAGQRCVVVGHSTGGMALLALAEAEPAWARARVAGSVLVSTAANEVFRYTAMSQGSSILTAAGRRLVPWLMGPHGLVGPDNDLMFYSTLAVSLTPDAAPGLVAEIGRLVLACPPVTRAGFAETLSRLDLSEGIPRVPGPVVVLVGERDRLTPPRQSAVVAAGRADAELVVLPETGHVAPLEAPEVVNARIDAIAEAVLGRGGGETGDAGSARATAGE